MVGFLSDIGGYSLDREGNLYGVPVREDGNLHFIQLGKYLAFYSTTQLLDQFLPGESQ
jgi:hypothetical protein